jgi:hypothetical protein
MSSTKSTKRNTSSKTEAQVNDPWPSSMPTNITKDTITAPDHPYQSNNSTAHTHENQTNADGARRKSADSDLMTWAHLSVDRSGAKIRTICTKDHEDGDTCKHAVRERRYRDIPRVDGPSEKITIEGAEAMMESDARVEKESDGEGEDGWIVIGRG